MSILDTRIALLAAAVLAITTARASVITTVVVEDPRPAVRTNAEQLDLLRRKLASDDLATRAWGAWGASEAQVRELAPDVLAALRRTLTEPPSDELACTTRALLDAAIRLDVQLSTDDLTPLGRSREWDAQVLTLASREPAAHVKLLQDLHTLGEELPERRIAADNLLAIGAPDRAVELLLPDAHVRLLVGVHDDGWPGRTFGSRVGRACGNMEVPEGFPPTVLYTLVRGSMKDADSIADGPQPIRAYRQVHEKRKFGITRGVRPLDVNQHALDLLRWIAGDRVQESSLAAEIRIRHDWTNPADYVAKVSDEIRKRHEAWRKLVDALVARELLPAERVPKEDPIDIEVEDLRKDQRVPLPELPR